MISPKQLILHQVQMPLKHPFSNSYTTVREKDMLIIELIDQDGVRGWGETVAFTEPWYTEETTATAAYMIEHHIWPLIQNETLHHPDELIRPFTNIKRNHMAKAAVEGAVWDLFAKRHNQPLYKVIGGTTNKIAVGASIGLQPDYPALLEKIETAMEEGYQRIKLKIKPEQDLDWLDTVRHHFPETPIMADANSAYTLKDLPLLKQLDHYNLMMIEQPLGSDDFVHHALLREEITTPICLDESIHTLADTQTAIALKSCDIISIKLGKVGGFTQARKIHALCEENQIPVWCGGMLEAGIGRAQSLSLATLPNFSLPADPGASSRYFQHDIIMPEVEVKKGFITLPEKPGIGYAIDRDALNFFTANQRVLT